MNIPTRLKLEINHRLGIPTLKLEINPRLGFEFYRACLGALGWQLTYEGGCIILRERGTVVAITPPMGITDVVFGCYYNSRMFQLFKNENGLWVCILEITH